MKNVVSKLWKCLLVSCVYLLIPFIYCEAQNPDTTHNRKMPPPPGNENVDHRRPPIPPGLGSEESRRNELESKRNMFLITHLQLTPQQTQAFIPLYHEYWTQLNALQKESRKDITKILGTDSVKMPEKEKIKIADNELTLRQKQLELFKKFHEKFKSAIPPLKVAQLYHFEDMFMEEQLMKNSRPGRPERPERGPQRN